MSSKLLLVLTGKTASGKDTVIVKLLKRFPDFKKILTTTSRLPRTGEKAGMDYNFVSEAEFNEKINKGEFVEYVRYGGNFYGTEKKQLEGTHLIWKIDPSRAGHVKDLTRDFKTLVIYLTVDDEIVMQRLKQRNLSQEEIEKRMQDDEKLWDEHKDNYDFIIENTPGKLQETVDQIIEIINYS